MSKIDISIIAVGYRSEDTILPFLDSIKKSKDGLKKEIIIVDNYPADKCADLAEKHSLKPLVLRNTENVGFSKAINWGTKKAQGKYFFIFNPDTRVVGNALRSLFDFAETKTVLGAVAPRLLNYDGKVQASCFHFPNITNAIRQNFLGYKNAYKKYIPGDDTAQVDIAVMAAMLVPKSTFEYVGGLDERFFLYYEDIEFCRRLHKFGLPIYYFPKAKVQHAHGASGNFTVHAQSPLLASAKLYYGPFYFAILNSILWIGHKWQVLLRGKKFRD
jgi:GT2 family glycosyltransferase